MIRGEGLGRRRLPDPAEAGNDDAPALRQPPFKLVIHLFSDEPPVVRCRGEPADLLLAPDSLKFWQVLREVPHSTVADQQFLDQLGGDLFAPPKMKGLALHLLPTAYLLFKLLGDFRAPLLACE